MARSCWWRSRCACVSTGWFEARDSKSSLVRGVAWRLGARVGSSRGSALGLRGTAASFCKTLGATPGQVPPRAAGVAKPSQDAWTSPAGAVG